MAITMKKFAWIFVLAAGILWGTIGIYVKKLNAAGLNSMDIVAIRGSAYGGCIIFMPADI